jgi:histidinol-phosphate aminotransferase
MSTARVARDAYTRPSVAGDVDLRLDGNEGPARWIAAAEARAALDPEVLRRYPDASALEAFLAARLGVDRARVLVTAGADEALDRACRAFLGPARSLVLPVPTFEMIERYAGLARARVLEVPWPTGKFPVEAVLARLEPDTAMVVVVSPNNPTGAVASRRDLERLTDGARDTVVLLDAAYGEFADEDLGGPAIAGGRALVVRTLSKAWGLAGLRIGYAVGPAAAIAALRAAGGPYPVAGPALALALLQLRAGESDMRAFVARVREEREALRAALVRLGAEALPSQANFVLARFEGSRAETVRTGLLARGIAVRSFPGRPGLEACLRITCPGEPLAMARLLRALDEVRGEMQGDA